MECAHQWKAPKLQILIGFELINLRLNAAFSGTSLLPEVYEALQIEARKTVTVRLGSTDKKVPTYGSVQMYPLSKPVTL